MGSVWLTDPSSMKYKMVVNHLMGSQLKLKPPFQGAGRPWYKAVSAKNRFQQGHPLLALNTASLEGDARPHFKDARTLELWSSASGHASMEHM